MNNKRARYSNLNFAKDLWHFFKIYKKTFVFFTVLLIISALLGLVPAIILAKIIDFFTIGGKSLNIFYIYLGILLGIGVFDTVLRLGSKHYFALFTNKIQKHAKVESFQKIMQGDLIWHDKESTGAKIQKINVGEQSLGDFMNFYVNKGISLVITIIGIVAVFAFFNIKYALVAILFLFTYLVVEFKLNKKLARKVLQQKIARERATGKVYEFSSNIGTIKALGIESSSNKQIMDQEEKILQAKKGKIKASTYKWISVQLIAIFFYTLFIFLVGGDVIIGILTIGSIVIYIDYVRRLQEVLNLISREATHLIDIKYGLFRMMQIYKTIPEVEEKDTEDLGKWKEIRIKNLGFKYKQEEVLENLNLDIKRGQKIGIVGKSGSGKSTLFKLFLKLYLPRKGMIYFDDKPITKIKKESILNKLSIIPQETELFNLSLKNNITISSPGKVDYDRYAKALVISQTAEIVSKLKNKDLTLIGEKGVRLSGGERQRLGIARAVYKDSDILILDEATSNLDYETERKILQAMNKQLKNKTLIISAHRLSTLKDADDILFIEKGKVIEQGTYNELLRKKGRFYKLWKEQENLKRD